MTLMRRSEPVFFVHVRPAGKNSEDIDITNDVLSFVFEDTEVKASLLKLTINNSTLEHFDREPLLLAQGNIIRFAWGYSGAISPTHECVITKIKGALKLTVEAQDKGVTMNRTTLSRTFENMTRAEVVRAVAKEEGWGETMMDVRDTGEKFPTITQAKQTNAQFIKRLANLEKFEFWVDWEGFHWRPKRVEKAPIRTLTYMLPPNVGDILTFDVENDLTAKPAQVTVKARDPLEKTTNSSTANDQNTPRTTLATTPAVLIDEVTLKRVVPPQASKNPVVTVAATPSTSPTQTAVKNEANNKFTGAQRVAVKMTGTLVGDPYLAAKNVVQIQGIGKRLSGKYYLTEVHHKIDSGGYTCTFKASTDGGQQKKPAASAAKPNTESAPAGTGGATPPAPARITKIDEVTLRRLPKG